MSPERLVAGFPAKICCTFSLNRNREGEGEMSRFLRGFPFIRPRSSVRRKSITLFEPAARWESGEEEGSGEAAALFQPPGAVTGTKAWHVHGVWFTTEDTALFLSHPTSSSLLPPAKEFRFSAWNLLNSEHIPKETFWDGASKWGLLGGLVLKSEPVDVEGGLNNYIKHFSNFYNFWFYDFFRFLPSPVRFPNNFACERKQN